jgi:pimeloyl-ACP methyl ester carboxylesterase
MTPISDAFADALADLPVQHIHGDCHGGNILLHDGNVSGILDNLLAEEAITTPVAIMVDTSANRVRDLHAYPPFTAFVVQELLPWARQNYSITRNPADTVVGGLSLGGVAAASAALQHPETFGNVVAQSGAFWNGREGECEGDGQTSSLRRPRHDDAVGVEGVCLAQLGVDRSQVLCSTPHHDLKPLALRRSWRGAPGAGAAVLRGPQAAPSSDARASATIRPGWNRLRKRPTAARRLTTPRSGRKATWAPYSPISLTAQA